MKEKQGMLATVYPITIAEMATFVRDADGFLSVVERELLTNYLAWHPEAGDILAGTGGVRKLRWPLTSKRNVPIHRIVYFFRDLNMPLYLLAVYAPGERIGLDAKSRAEMSKLTAQLIGEHYSEKLARLVAGQPEGA